VELNGFTNVEIVNRPLWHSEATIKLYRYVDSGSNSLYPRSNNDVSILVQATTTLDAVVKGRKPKLVKMDCEGSEYAILHGGSAVLSALPYLLTELNDSALRRAGSSIEQMRSLFSEYQSEFPWRGLFLLSTEGQLPSYLPTKTQLRSNHDNFNVLFSTFDRVAEAWPYVEVVTVPNDR
jgi:hypothetical protein